MTVEEFISRIPGGAKKRGRFWYAHVPGREDRNPSLSIWEENGWIKLRDWAGQSTDQDVVAALGLTNRDLRIEGAPENTQYTYVGKDGQPKFRKIRKPDPKRVKTFTQVGINGEKNLAHLNGDAKVLYRLNEVRKAVQVGRTVYVCEGEKAVEALRAEKCVATCQPSGGDESGANWLDSHTEEFKGADVIIVADRDKTGDGYSLNVWRKLRKVCRSVKVVRSKTIGEKDDAFDHLCAGFTVEEFVEAPDLMVMPDMEVELASLGLVRLSTVQPAEVEWLWYPYIPLRRCTLIDGDGDVGKTYMACALAACLTRGRLPNGKPLPFGPRNVLLLMSEDEADDTIVPRIISFGGDRERVFHARTLFPFDAAGMNRLDRMCEAIEPIVAIIDPVLAYCSAAVNINQANEVRPIFDGLKNVMSRHNCAGLNIRHTGKSNEGRAAHHAGLGSVDIRNAHRSQLTVEWHPDVKGLRVINHRKHNLSEEGAPFGYEFRDGEFTWNWTIPDTRPSTDNGKKTEAMEFLKSYLTGQYMPVVKINELAESLGIKKRTLEAARAELGVKAVKAGASDGWLLHLPADDSDPFLED